MSSLKVATRYAKSLLGMAIERNQLGDAHKDMMLIDETCSSSRELSLLLCSPIVKTDKKQVILKQVFESRVSEMTAGFIEILTRKKREALLGEVAKAFIGLYKAHNRILTAEVTTATPLDDGLRAKVMAIVKELDHNEVDLIEKVNPKLIGGIILRVGDHQIDASVKKKIRALQRELTDHSYIADF